MASVTASPLAAYHAESLENIVGTFDRINIPFKGFSKID